MTENTPDFIETKTAKLLKAAKRSGFFMDAINEAKELQKSHGFVWDVALYKSCQYWCSNGVTPFKV